MRTTVVESGEESQTITSLEQRPFDLHLPAREWLAAGEALWARQKLGPGFNLVSNHLQTLLLHPRGCTHPMALSVRGV